jgi:hypothetical protein
MNLLCQTVIGSLGLNKNFIFGEVYWYNMLYFSHSFHSLKILKVHATREMEEEETLAIQTSKAGPS